MAAVVASGGDGCVRVDAREGDRGGDELEGEVEASRGCRGAAREIQGDEGARRQGGGGRRVAARAGHARSSPSGVSWKRTRERDGLGQQCWANTLQAR